MLPGITTALFGGVALTAALDGATRSLIKCNGPLLAVQPTFSDFAKPSRQWTSKFANSSIQNSGAFGTAWESSVSGDALMSPIGDPDYNFSGNFTIDFWCAVGTVTTARYILFKGPNANAYASYAISTFNNQLGFGISSNNTAFDIQQFSGAILSTYVWFHVALVRSGNTYTLYVNGTAVASGTSANAPKPTNDAVIFGSDTSGNYFPDVLVDEIRFSSVARWTANFTPPTAPYYGTLSGGNDPATKLLLHGEGTPGVAGSTDSAAGASVAHPMTFLGGAILGGAGTGKFGNTSLYFNGAAGTRITIPNSADFDFHAVDFTVELWYYRASTTSGHLLTKRAANAVFAPWWIWDSGSGVMQVYFSSNGSAWTHGPISLGTAAINTWTHLAVVRRAGLITCYNNGVATGTVTPGFLWLNNDVLSIGGVSDGFNVNGYLDEIRISDVARWSTAFSPPAAAYA